MPPICDDGIALQPGGALVLLEELVVVEPTAAQAAQRRERREQALRTLSITAPAVCFGTVSLTPGNVFGSISTIRA
jgi:hypothetical protein